MVHHRSHNTHRTLQNGHLYHTLHRFLLSMRIDALSRVHYAIDSGCELQRWLRDIAATAVRDCYMAGFQPNRSFNLL